NGLNFEYGDYLNVNFKTSANLYLNDVSINNKIQTNYRIKNNELFEINKNGLSFVENVGDTSTLKQELAMAMSKAIKGAYTVQSYNNLENAIKNAQAVLTKIEPSAQSVNEAQSDLTSALNGLKFNIGALQSELTLAKNKLANGEYTRASYLTLLNAIQGAEILINGQNISVSGIQAAKTNLQNAINGLVIVKDSKVANTPNQKKAPIVKPESKEAPVNNSIIEQQKALLKTYIESANNDIKKAGSDYTETSVVAFEKIINNAKAVLENKNATAQEVQGATQSILKGFRDLQITKAPLENQIKLAKEKINENIYTKASVESLNDSITNAQNILKETDPTIYNIENAQEQLSKGITGLQKAVVERPQAKTTSNSSNGTITKIPNTTVSNNVNSKKVTSTDISSANKNNSNNDSIITNIENGLKGLFSGIGSWF
ncbi:MAG: hypothetical protein ACRC41_09495, partial [Sarcina sp.]